LLSLNSNGPTGFLQFRLVGGFYTDSVSSIISAVGKGSVNEIASVRAEGNAGQAITANITDIPFIKVNDTHGAWNGTQYTVQNDNSIVNINLSIFSNNTISMGLDLYKNGVSYKRLTQATSDNIHARTYISTRGEFLKDDLLTVRAYSGTTLISGSPNLHYLNINETATSPLAGLL